MNSTPMPHGISAAGDWSIVKLDGKVMPGLARVDVNLPVEIDIQKATEKKKARLKDSGDLPTKLTITLTLWLLDHVIALKLFMPLLKPNAVSGKREARTIEHPNAQIWGVDKVVVTSIKSPQPDLVNGWKVEIECLEWVKEPKKVAAPKVEAAEERDRKAFGKYADDGSYAPPTSGTGPHTLPSKSAEDGLF
jgi:hypothetical protein